MGPRNHVLDGVKIVPREGAIFREKDMPGHAGQHSAMSCANKSSAVAEMGDRGVATIDMRPFRGSWDPV